MNLHGSRIALIVFSFAVAISFFPSAVSAQAVLLPEEQAWLEKHGHEVVFAPEKDFPPFMWEQYETLFGISTDYLNYIQQGLEISFDKKESRSRTEILESMKAGEMVFASSLTETTERSQYLLFTRPYFVSPALYIGKSGFMTVTVNDILTRKLKVVVGDGYGVHQYLKNRYPRMVLIPSANDYLVLEKLESGEADVAVLDAASLSYLIAEHELKNLKKIGETGFTYSFSFAVPSAFPELRNILDTILESVPHKTATEIRDRWITNPVALNSLAGNASVLLQQDVNSDSTLAITLSAILMLLLGFILHYFYVRVTPRKDERGHNEYIP